MEQSKVKHSFRVFLFGIVFLLCGVTLGSLLLYSAIPDHIQVFSNETKTLDLPMKEVKISVLPEKTLIVGGHSVGVRMDVSGVLVVGLEEISTEQGKVNPGLQAGIQIGDSVLSVEGISVNSADDVQKALNNGTPGRTVRLKSP